MQWGFRENNNNNNNKNNKNLDENKTCLDSRSEQLIIIIIKNNKNLDENNTCSDGRSEQLIKRLFTSCKY